MAMNRRRIGVYIAVNRRKIGVFIKVACGAISLTGFFRSLQNPGARDGFLLATLWGIVSASWIAMLLLALWNPDINE
jgi:hypothetical protein